MEFLRSYFGNKNIFKKTNDLKILLLMKIKKVEISYCGI